MQVPDAMRAAAPVWVPPLLALSMCPPWLLATAAASAAGSRGGGVGRGGDAHELMHASERAARDVASRALEALAAASPSLTRPRPSEPLSCALALALTSHDGALIATLQAAIAGGGSAAVCALRAWGFYVAFCGPALVKNELDDWLASPLGGAAAARSGGGHAPPSAAAAAAPPLLLVNRLLMAIGPAVVSQSASVRVAAYQVGGRKWMGAFLGVG